MDQNSQPPQEGETPSGEPTRYIGPTGDYVPPQEPQQPQQPGYPPQGAPPPGYQQPGYPPQQPGFPPPGYQPQQPGYPPQPAAGRGFPVWAWIIIGVVVLTCIGLVGLAALYGVIAQRVTSSGVVPEVVPAIRQASGEMNTAEAFYDNLISGNYASAHALLGGSLASQYTADSLRTRWEAFEAGAGKVADKHWIGSVVEPTVDAILVMSNGRRYEITLTMGESGNSVRIVDASPDVIPSP